MTLEEKVRKDLSLRKMLDPRVVKAIVTHPILFTKQRISDTEDTRPIRLRYLAVFTPKYKKDENNRSEVD